MRIARSFRPLLVVIALSGVACAGTSSPAPATPAPASVATASAADPITNKPPGEDDDWAGENAAKSGSSKPIAASDGSVTNSDSKPAETRTREVIGNVVLANRKAARKCYEDARKDSKDLKGDLTVHFVIDPEGNVKTAALNQERSTLTSPALVDCVISVIKGLKFPKSSRAMESSTNYPFNFTP
jgi:hypothetical protein